MAKISELPAASALTGAEVVPLVQSSVTVRTTVTDLLAAAPATPAVVSDDLLKVNNATLGLDATLRALEDGNGASAPLQLSTSAVMLPEGAVFPFGNSTRFTSGETGIILPFYVYPNNPYTDPVVARLLGLIRQYRDEVPVIVVINPDSGPGLVWDGNWAALITVLKAAGACVAGYVSTVYATRPSGEVFADINGWLSLYGATPIDCVFFDEQPYDVTVGSIDTVALYKSYTDYCHARNLFPNIGNPGTNQRGEHFATRTADLIIVHENSTWPAESDMLGNYVGGHVDYPYALRAALVYGQSVLVPGKIKQLAKYVQYIYVTDDVLPSPWDSLPPYFEQLFAILAGRDEFNVLDYGAIGDGTTSDTTGFDAARTAAIAAGGGVVKFPYATGGWNYTFTAPVEGVRYEWEGDANLIDRTQTGGSGSMRFSKGTMEHFTGTHNTYRKVSNYIRVKTDGSGYNGPIAASFAQELHVEKDSYLTTTQPGEIDGLYIFIRQGGDTNPATEKSAACAVLCDVVGKDGCGYIGISEASTQLVNSAGVAQKTINIQQGILNGRDGDYHGHLLTASVGTMQVAYSAKDTGSATWGDFLRSTTGGVLTYKVSMAGKTTTKTDDTGTTEINWANTAGVLDFKNNAGTTLFSIQQTRPKISAAGITADSTITTAGTTGARTINKPAGSVNIAAAGTSVVVTNSLVTTSSIVLAVCATADATAYVRNVVPAAGSFTITLGAAATAETRVNFFVLT